MITQVGYGKCPLCHRYFPVDNLRVHAKSESEELQRYTIDMIRSLHPEWVQEDGSCPKCWEYYSLL